MWVPQTPCQFCGLNQPSAGSVTATCLPGTATREKVLRAFWWALCPCLREGGTPPVPQAPTPSLGTLMACSHVPFRASFCLSCLTLSRVQLLDPPHCCYHRSCVCVRHCQPLVLTSEREKDLAPGAIPSKLFCIAKVPTFDTDY